MKLRSLLSLATVAAVAMAVGCSNDTGTNPVSDGAVAVDATSGKDREMTPDLVGAVEGGDAAAKRGKARGGLVGGLVETADDVAGEAADVEGLLDRVTLHEIDVLKSKVISAVSGGKLSAGLVNICVPPGALNVDTEISIVVLHGANDEVDFELLPHGTTFNVPVTLEVNMNTDYGPHDDVRQYWLDETTGDWVDVGGTWHHPTMTTEIDHFSRWKTRAGW